MGDKMSDKINGKIVMAIAGAIGSVLVAAGTAGVVAYIKKPEFKKMVNEKLYPQLVKIVKDNGAFAIRSIIEVALIKYPKAKLIFLNIVNAIEAGKVKIPKHLEKELAEIKNELPTVLDVLQKSSLSLT